MPECDRLDSTYSISVYVTSQLEEIRPASLKVPHKIMSNYEITWWKLLPENSSVTSAGPQPQVAWQKFPLSPSLLPSHRSRGLGCDQEIPVCADPVLGLCFLASHPRPGWHLLGCTALNLIGIILMENKEISWAVLYLELLERKF